MWRYATRVTEFAPITSWIIQVAFGDSLLTGWCSDASPVENGVAVQTYMETGSQAGLAHGEAIKLFSLFYNEEAKGNEIFEEIKVHDADRENGKAILTMLYLNIFLKC